MSLGGLTGILNLSVHNGTLCFLPKVTHPQLTRLSIECCHPPLGSGSNAPISSVSRPRHMDVCICTSIANLPTYLHSKGTTLVQTSQLIWPCCSPLSTPRFHRDRFQVTLPTGELAHTHVDISQALAPRGFQAVWSTGSPAGDARERRGTGVLGSLISILLS